MKSSSKYVYLGDILRTPSEELDADLERGEVDMEYLLGCIRNASIETGQLCEQEHITLDSSLMLTLTLRMLAHADSVEQALMHIVTQSIVDPQAGLKVLVDLFHIGISTGMTFERERQEELQLKRRNQ